VPEVRNATAARQRQVKGAALAAHTHRGLAGCTHPRRRRPPSPFLITHTSSSFQL